MYAGVGSEASYFMIGKILAVGFACAGMTAGQIVSAPATASAAAALAATAAATPTKAAAFDVISIRQNKTPMQLGMHQFDPTEDGYPH